MGEPAHGQTDVRMEKMRAARMTDKIGICNWAFPALQDPECCAALRAAGIAGLQLELGPRDATAQPLCSPSIRRRWLEAAADCGITLLSLMLTGLMTHSLTGRKGKSSLKAAWDMLTRGLHAARALGLNKLCLPSFSASAVNDEDDLCATADFLRRAVAFARFRNVAVVTENVLPPPKMERLTAEVPGCALYIDAANYRFFRNESLVPRLSRLAAYGIDEIHMKDGSVGKPGTRLLGEGDAEIGACLTALKTLGYKGWLVLENYYTHPSFIAESTKPFDLLRRDIAYLRRHFFNAPQTNPAAPARVPETREEVGGRNTERDACED